MVARRNGSLRPVHQLEAELADDAVRAGLQAPNLDDTVAISGALRELAEKSGSAGERGGLVSLLIPDAAVRLALVPLEGAEPRRTEGESMARWALRDLLPVEGGEARVAWSLVAEETAEHPHKWLLAVGADSAVVREYESVVEQMGWTVGRVVPLTLAMSVGADRPVAEDDRGAARLLLSGTGGQVACLVEANGVPRLHRAWRGSATDLDLELPNIARYVTQRLELSIVEAVVAGPEQWRAHAGTACEAIGWRVRIASRWSAHMGAVQV